MKNSILTLALGGCIIFFNLNLFAQTDPGFHEHDGFFLRLNAGAGYASMEEPDIMGKDLELKGAGGIFSVQIGGIVAENLAVFGEASGVTVSNPDFQWGTLNTTTSETDLSITGFGGGVTYYLMPQNIYFSFSLLLCKTSIKYNNVKGDSDSGIGVNVSVGKEWWVSGDWALGASVWGHYSSMDDGDISTITNSAFGVTFSATLN